MRGLEISVLCTEGPGKTSVLTQAHVDVFEERRMEVRRNGYHYCYSMLMWGKWARHS